MLAPKFALDNKYSAFGRVIEGMAAVDAIAVGEPPAQPTRIVKGEHRGAGRRRSGGAPTATRTRGYAVGSRTGIASARSACIGNSGSRSLAPRLGVWTLMRVDLFDFDLPADRIALRPARPRDSARLLAGRRRSLVRSNSHRPPAALAARRHAGLQRYEGHSRPARRPPRRGEHRCDSSQARRPAELVVVRPQCQAAANRRQSRIWRRRGGFGGRAGRGRAPSCSSSMAMSRSS